MTEVLTEREQEILVFLARGLSNKEIARQLNLAEKTVRWYNTQIYRKLDVRDRQEAIARAGRIGSLGHPHTPTVVSVIPPQATPFVGRQRDLARISALLAEADIRLVTILAPGGMGKTRLSLEVAKAQIGMHPDGVFFVPLAPLSSVGALVHAIAEQVGCSFYGEDTAAKQLRSYLRDRSLLLILDNFEHLLDAAGYVDEILGTAPGVRILTTSRERLRLQREAVYILRGLDVPSGMSLVDSMDHDAVRLFLQQAHRIRPDFALSSGDVQRVIQICGLSSGMPLAIELAAGWLDTLSLDHIVAEIQRGIDIFETEMRDVPERHRSIRATFELTWQRLAEADQQVFMRLSVLRGGFTAEAATAIAGADRHSLRTLNSLALIEHLDNGRYTLHELLRQFGAEKLEQASDRARVQAAHTAYFSNFMAKRQQEIRTNRQLEAVELIDPDFENVRTAWLHALTEQGWGVLLVFLDSLRFYCEVRTRSQDGIDLLQQAVEAIQVTPVTDAQQHILGSLLARLSWFYYDIGLADKSIVAGDEAVRILRQHNHTADLLAALFSRQAVALAHRQFDIGIQALEEGLRLARSLDDTYWEGHFLVWSAIAYITQNDPVASRPLAEDGLALFERLGDQWGLMRACTILGDIEETQKNFRRAHNYFRRSLMISETFDHNFTIAANTTELAIIALQEGDERDARRLLRSALQALWEAGYLWASPFPLACFARTLAAQNEQVKAVEILATIDKHLTTFRRNEQIARTLRDEFSATMDPERFAAAWARGEQRDIGTLIVECLGELR